MKSHILWMVLLLTCLMVGISLAEPNAQWNMTGAFNGAGEMTAHTASNAGSLIRINPGSKAFSKGLGDVVVCTQTGPADFLRVDINDLAANGGGDYVNAYTMVLDLRIDKPDWLPLYNTNFNNESGNEAEVWISSSGEVGAGPYYQRRRRHRSQHLGTPGAASQRFFGVVANGDFCQRRVCGCDQS